MEMAKVLNFQKRGFGAITPALPLSQGAKGFSVSQFQQKLKQLGYGGTGFLIDGVFGPITEGAVKAFQLAQRLPVTGTVDQATWDAIAPETSPSSMGPDQGVTNNVIPLNIPPVQPTPRPLWQTGMLVLGGLSIVGVLIYLFMEDKPKHVSGYRRLLSDDVDCEKCQRVPPDSTLERAEELEVV